VEEAEEIDLDADNAGDGMDEDEEDEPDFDMTGFLQKREEDMMRKAYDLVRLALFNEVRRMPLKREEINKKGASSIPSRYLIYINTCGISLNSSTK
jgi:hypothetical protein